jgi:hypothetical protein
MIKFSAIKSISLRVFVVLQILLVGNAFAQAPNPPTNVQATDGTSMTSIGVSWTAPGSGPAVSLYRIYRSVINDPCGPSGIEAGTVGSGTTNFNDTSGSLVNGQVYYYGVRSASASNELSTCSLTDSGFLQSIVPPLPPVSVSATTNLYDRITVTWAMPSGSETITSYKIFRSTDSLDLCQGSPIATPAVPSLLYSDTAAVAGTVYYYTMSSIGPNGESACTPTRSLGFRLLPPPPLRPANVQASDGTFTDKILVTWQAPIGSEPISFYRLYRTTIPGAINACQTLLQDNIAASTFSLNDTSGVIPGKLYYYSMKSSGPTGESQCSTIDPGYARILPPANVQATDGTFTDRVRVTWAPPTLGGDVTGYKIYKSSTSQSCNTIFQVVNSNSVFNIDDTNVIQGTDYFYSIKTVSPAGDSDCSPIDPGFARKPVTICSNGLDDDLDGLIDLLDPGCKGDPTRNDEKDPDGPHCDNGRDDDGDGKIDFRIDSLTDTSCSSPRDGTEDDTDVALKSPAYIKFNTYLGQWNFAELVNQGVGDKQVDLTLYNLYGQKMISRKYVVPGQSQVDVDVNALVQFACNVLKTACDKFVDHSEQGVPNGLDRPDGVVDTYGLVELVFDDDNSSERILGRMSFYRPNVDGDFSFAFAREFKNPNKGTSYSTANTYDPQGSGFLVPNWAEVINLDTVNRSYTVNVYDQEGNLKASKGITLAPLGEFDVQAGHEFIDANGKVVEGVFLVEVIPQDATAPYYLSVSRYSSNSKPGVHPETYNYAMAIDGLSGTTDKIFAPIGNTISGISSLTDRPAITNWVEVVNVDTIPADVVISFRALTGNILFTQAIKIPAKGQFHFNAGALLPKGTIGSVELQSNAKVISQGMSYAHGTDNGLQTGFTSVARPAGAQEQVGTINTFLGMKNAFEIVSTVASGTDVDFKITTFSGATKTGVIGLGSGTNQSFQITDNSALNITENTYGAMILKSSSAGRFMGEVRRLRISKGKLDFVMPTGVR